MSFTFDVGYGSTRIRDLTTQKYNNNLSETFVKKKNKINVYVIARHIVLID